jgi:hypothetical protein
MCILKLGGMVNRLIPCPFYLNKQASSAGAELVQPELNLLEKSRETGRINRKITCSVGTSSHTIDEPETHQMMSHELSSPVSTGFSFIIMRQSVHFMQKILQGYITND